jgi:hypothetical protein
VSRAYVTYPYRQQDLLKPLSSKAPSLAAALISNHRRVHDGLISVGLKIHCLDDGRQFDRLVGGLGGASKILDINLYKHANASLCDPNGILEEMQILLSKYAGLLNRNSRLVTQAPGEAT